MGASGGSEGGHTIEDEGISLNKRKKLNFVGAGVEVTDDSGEDASKVTISGSGVGEANTSSNVGIGEGLALAKDVVDLPFKSLKATLPLTISSDADSITYGVNETKLDDAGIPDDNTDLDATALLHGLMPKADKSKLGGIEASAKDDLTGAEIKALYEAIANAFTDTKNTKLAGIATSAEVNPPVISQGDAEAGISNLEKIWTAVRVKQAIDALSGGGSSNVFARVVKKVTEIVNNSNTQQDDDELFVALNANKTYGFLVVLFWNVGAIPDLLYGFTAPTDATGKYTNSTISSDTSVITTALSNLNFAPGTTPDRMSIIFGTVKNLTNAGDFTCQWSQNTPTVEDSKMLEGASLLMWEEKA